MIVEYVIAGAVLLIGGAVHRYLRRELPTDEQGRVRGWWTIVVGWVVMFIGIVLLAAGTAGVRL